MSDKAETVTCEECGGLGITGAVDDVPCRPCSGTGVRTMGEVVDGSSGVVPLTVGQGVSPLTVGQGVVPLTVTTPAYIKPALGLGASGLPKENATGHDGCIRGLEKANATIAEQAAEIERLRERVSGLEQLHASWADGSLAEITTDRDQLRLEVQRLKDLNFEAQDRYAALEAERDALRRAIDAAMRTIAAQNAQVRSMNEQLDAVTQLIVQQVKESHD